MGLRGSLEAVAVGGVQFGLLGPLVLADATGRSVQVAGPRLRVLLAALLLDANTPVSNDVLAEALWDGAPPPAAVRTLRSHVARLRRLLGPEAGRVAAREPGYLIRVEPKELDVAQFEALCSDAGVALRSGEWSETADTAARALRLWRGAPLLDIPSQPLHDRVRPRLEQLRLQVLEDGAQARLHLGHHERLVSQLRELTTDHPLRERFHAQLMLALARAGRQAEALGAYQHARHVLVGQLGVEPGPELRDLHERILAGDTGLLAPPRSESTPRPASPPETPRQLPAGARHFVGRAGELMTLSGLLTQEAAAGGAVVISAIGGTAGVGKTALAVHWAHLHADRFPDGQLYVNLRGYDPDQPVPAADALAEFLRSLGVAGRDIPPGEDERATLYRSLLAGKKMLVVLDNAGSVEQARPLLPGTTGCAVVVTSRDTLAGLVARNGATRLVLDLLPPAEAAGLLRTLIGARAEDDPSAADELADQCCRLPLALRVAAELATARPDVPLAGLVAELADQRRRLDLLDAGGDPRTAVRAVFSWSHRHLDDDAARAFGLAGLHPGPDFDPYAAAALTGLRVEQARTVLGVLARAHLIQPAGAGRYGMHDLLRAYARELATRDGQEEQDAALTRLFDYYLHTAANAMDTLHPGERHRRPRIPPPDTPTPPVTEPFVARSWLDAERATLVAIAVHAAGHGWSGHATRLSATLGRYLDVGGHYPEAITIHSHARATAQREGGPSAEAAALNNLGNIHRLQGRYQQAADHHRQALALFRQVGDRPGQAQALNNLGLIEFLQGRYREAIGLVRQAQAIHRETGNRYGMANTINNLGECEARLGRYGLAARHLRQALAISSDIGARNLECHGLLGLGTLGLRQGRYQLAATYLDRALALTRETGFRDQEAEALARIGDLCLRQGHPEEATGQLREALALYRELGNQSGEADALNSLGEVLLTTGQPDHACAKNAAALSLAAQTDDRYLQARAHRGLGRACRAVGDPDQARRHWQQALALFTELGTPEADQVRAEIAAADYDQHPIIGLPPPRAARQARPSASPVN